jgi:hypothetical protein
LALLTLQEFRDKRDDNALKGYRLRWPVLNDKRNALRKQIDCIKKVMDTHVLTEHGKKAFEEDKYKLLAEFSDVVSELAMIEQDAPIRKMNLGLIPVPKNPSPEIKMRLTVFMHKSVSLFTEV